jgi:DNA-binding MarR family transcriptional regulator
MNILVAIAHAGPVRGVDVARYLGLDTSTLSRDLERLLARRWVRSRPGKGRTRLLEATSAGRRLIARTLPAWRTAQRAARDLLTPAAAEAITAAVEMVRAEKSPVRH